METILKILEAEISPDSKRLLLLKATSVDNRVIAVLTLQRYYNMNPGDIRKFITYFKA